MRDARLCPLQAHDVCRQLQATDVAFYVCRKNCARLAKLRRLRRLEDESARLKRPAA